MTRKQKTWKKLFEVGGRGHTVAVMKRLSSPFLYLRWWDPTRNAPKGNYVWTSLEHADLEKAETAARAAAAVRLQGVEVERGEAAQLAYVFARYEEERTAQKNAREQKEDRRRMDTWQAYLGGDFDPMELSGDHLRRFEALRRAGKLVVPGHALRKVRNRAIHAAEAFLHTVLSWASSLNPRTRIIPSNPIAGYQKPRELNPKRPRTSFDVFKQVDGVTDAVDPQKLFRPFHRLVEALGWRVSAICELRAADLDLRRFRGVAPHGRIRKREESDKVGVDQWVPLSRPAREAVDMLLSRRPAVGEAPLFPGPRSKKGEPWTRHHATALLKRAYTKAEVSDAERVGWHAYRRKWVDERKHHPRADVAAAGGWLTDRTLEIYEQPDEKTVLEVVSETRKLRRPRQIG